MLPRQPSYRRADVVAGVRCHLNRNTVFIECDEFHLGNRERKLELIKIDAYNLMIWYLHGRISYSSLQEKIEELGTKGQLSEVEIKEFIDKRISYESYQVIIIIKDRLQRQKVKERLINYRDKQNAGRIAKKDKH